MLITRRVVRDRPLNCAFQIILLTYLFTCVLLATGQTWAEVKRLWMQGVKTYISNIVDYTTAPFSAVIHDVQKNVHLGHVEHR